MEITVTKRPKSIFKPFSELVVSEANKSLPKIGDQLMYIQQAVHKYQAYQSDENALEVQTLLNGFVEIVVVQGTGRELVGSGMLTTQARSVSSAETVPAKKKESKKSESKKTENEIVPSQTAMQFIIGEKVTDNPEVQRACFHLLEFATQKLTEFKFPASVTSMPCAWRTTLVSIHVPLLGSILQTLEKLDPGTFATVSISSFQLFCTSIKGYVKAIDKTALRKSLEAIAKKKTKELMVVQVEDHEAKNQGNSSNEESDASEDDNDFCDTDYLIDKELGNDIDKISEGKDGELNGADMLLRLRNQVGKQPRHLSKAVRFLFS